MRRTSSFVLLLIAIVLFLSGCTQNYSTEKIKDSSEVPDCVATEMGFINVERGIYFFSESFTGEDAYIIYCGGEDYGDGYDVNITNIDYNPIIKTASPPGKPAYGFYQIDCEEINASAGFDYGIDVEHPIIIFKLYGSVGEQAWPVIKDINGLGIIQWWGSSEKEVDCKYASSMIVNMDESSAPEGVVDLFKRRSELNSHTNGQNTERYSRWFKISASNPYEIYVESLTWSQDAGGGYACSIVISSRSIDSPAYDIGEYYYALLEVDLLHERAYLGNYLHLDSTLSWEIE